MKRRFPQYLNSPMQILFFEADTAMILLLFAVIGWIASSWIGTLLMVAGPWAYARAKKKYPKSYLQHLIYFVGLKDVKNYPSAFHKEFQE